jgi:lipoprotein-releasing system permease protein
VVGISIITAAMVILLSAFNGIESMVERLYTEFDTDITIRSSVGKTFSEETIDFKLLRGLTGVASVSRAVEEVVVLKHEKKWVNAKMIGVDSSYLEMTNMSKHMVDGNPLLRANSDDFALIGATLLDKLNGFIPEKIGYESLMFYVPKRDVGIRVGSNPFTTRMVKLSGKMNFNREVNAESILVPIDLARELLYYESDITAIYLNVKPGYTAEEVQETIQHKFGNRFTVKTGYEKNELIYKTSKTEKLIVLIILLFIFILAAFNLVASLTMLFIEKKDNVKTMIVFGADRQFVFRIFFLEGIMISFKGVLIGLTLGYAICLSQIYGDLLILPNSGGESFPMALSLFDGVLIFSLVSTLSLLASYLPVKYLIKKNFEKEVF